MDTNLAAAQTQPMKDAIVRPHLANPEPLFAGAELAKDEFTRFFELSLDLHCIAVDGYFKRLNPAWTTCLGWAQEALSATPILDFVHPDDREATRREIASLESGGVATLFESRFRQLDGAYRWLQWNALPIPGSGLIYATARDITRQKWLEREVIEVADREKERLGRELHDGLCQSLTGISALSTTLSRTLAANADLASSRAAAEITQLLNDAIDEARDMARGLVPVGLRECRLDEALEALALTVEKRLDISCKVSCAIDRGGPFPASFHEAGTHLFRIVQEAVSNATTHGQAERIDISLRCTNGQGLLSIEDDGVGLPDEAHHQAGIGLQSMAFRASMVGGSLEVRRGSSCGTLVTCSFALPASPGPCEIARHVRNAA